jgi:hypothetical protein
VKEASQEIDDLFSGLKAAKKKKKIDKEEQLQEEAAKDAEVDEQKRYEQEGSLFSGGKGEVDSQNAKVHRSPDAHLQYLHTPHANSRSVSACICCF